MPGPGRSVGGCVFSRSFLGSKSLRFVLLAAKLGSRDYPLTASTFGLYSAGPTVS